MAIRLYIYNFCCRQEGCKVRAVAVLYVALEIACMISFCVQLNQFQSWHPGGSMGQLRAAQAAEYSGAQHITIQTFAMHDKACFAVSQKPYQLT